MLLFGDKWSLVIIRDIMLLGMSSYSEFLSSERIASNILQSLLSKLTEHGLLIRRGSLSSKTKVLYTLTDEAIELIPIILELMAWGNRHIPDGECMQLVKRYRRNPVKVIEELKTNILKQRETTKEQMLY